MQPDQAETRLTDTLQNIRSGNQQSREQLLAEYKPYIAKVASNLCRRYLDWNCDDELSIGLIAFNTAIDLFKPDKGTPFLPFARLVIESRLKDYFKKESRHQHISLEYTGQNDEDVSFSPGEIENAWKEYQAKSIEDERNLEIDELDKQLADYGIEFEMLPDIAPRHKETRANLHKAAKSLASHPDLMQKLLNKKSLPVKELSLTSSVTPKTIEKGRKYIIAIALILYNYQEFSLLRSYIAD